MKSQANLHKPFFFFVYALALISQGPLFQSLWRPFARYGYKLIPLVIILSVLLLVESCQKYKSQQQILIFILALLTIVISWNSGYLYGYVLWTLFVFIVGAKNILYKDIVKCNLLFSVFLLIINTFAYQMNWIDKSLVFLSDERESMITNSFVSRMSLGYPAASDLGLHIMYMVLDIFILSCYTLRKRTYITLFITILGGFYIVTFLCDSRMGGGSVILILLSLLYIRRLNNKKINMSRFMAYFIIISFPLFFGISLWAVLSYDYTDVIWVATDVILSGRLHLSLDGIEEFGISLFGQNIELIGGGYADVIGDYNYLDSAYIQFLIRWGIFGIAVFLLEFVKIGKDAYKRQDTVLLLSLLIVSLSSVTNQFVFSLHYCVLPLALMATHNHLESFANANHIKFIRQ